MPCDRQSIPWWTPLVISVTVCGSAITLKALYAVMGFIRRHRSYRATALSRNRFRSTQGASVDVELGGAIPITSRLSLDGPEDETDWDASDGFADADEMGSLIHSRFLLKPYRKSLAPTARLSDSEGANYLHRLSHTPQNRTDWNNFRGRTFGQTLPSMVSHDLSRFDNTHEQTWWTGLRQWFNAKHIGLTARQRLTMKLYCEQFTTVSYPAGKIMLTVYIVLCTISWLFYLIETYDEPPISIIGRCYTVKMKILAWLNFLINFFCLGYYILRFCAATDRIRFILSFSSIIDLVAIPISLLAAFQTHRHVDLNFLRATCIFNYVDVLTYLGVIKSNRSIQSARICFALFTMWMVGSGIMHVIEHLGDFWEDTPHEGSWSYFEACYFLLVTLSTVGYGDYVTHTALGKLFICVFIPVAMCVSASFIPELIRMFSTNNTVASERYETMHGERHVLVCGNFDNGSLRAFIKGFLTGGGAKGRVRLNMVILRPIPIDLALKAILSHYHAWVRYFVGTPNNPQDLARAKMQDARAAIVLATPNAKRRDADDAANIMQAISLKARKKTLRVVVQLHNFRNKCLINNFPRWTYLVNDMVVCMEELKLGLMAYNCLAPGFATLVLNLLNIHGSKCISKQHFERWREEYEYGFRMELHDVGISHEFNNLFMRDFAIFLYEKWNVVLVAVRSSEVDKSKMIINPIEKNCVVTPSKMRAIVIARDYSDALQLQDYCTSCLSHLTGHRCSCRKPERTRRQKVTIERDLALYEKMGRTRQLEGLSKLFDSPVDDESFETVPSYYRHSIAVLGPIGPTDQRNLHAMFNGGTFAGPDRSGFRFASVKLKRKRLELEAPCAYEARDTDPPLSPGFRFYQSRVNKVDRTGSFHWAPDMPYSKATLTSSQAGEFQFNNHILVCVVSTTTNSPLNLENFIMPLRFHWKQIQDIVILGNSQLIGQQEWDKLKNFPRIFIVHGDPCSFTDLYAVQLSKCNACVILGDTNEELDSQSVDICLQDQKTLLCAMNIRSLLQRERHLVHLTTELRYERNAHLFSSVETHENDYKLPVWFNEPFARGFIFSNSLLYSCLSSFFYNEDVFHFLRVLISGQATDELETSFAVGAGLQEGLPDQTYRMPGVNVVLRGFDDPPFCFMANEQRRKPLMFREVFLRCMTCWQILCLGLYRMENRGFRYVLANPQPKTILYSTDMFYCFMPITKTDQPESFPFGTPPKLMLSPTIWKPQTTTRMELK